MIGRHDVLLVLVLCLALILITLVTSLYFLWRVRPG